MWKIVRKREQPLGTRNIVGTRVKKAREDQNMKQKELLQRIWEFGIDMGAPALSKIEGQSRYVTDYELLAIAESLNVSVGWLLGRDTR